jgi:predicted ATPase/DNA-binding SARP family transcriptional activator/Tfp pilus assembly protein PilF
VSTRVTLFGRPAIHAGQERFEPVPGKISGLLYRLAFQGGWVSRNDLAYLFWPDSTEERARSNLRKTLTRAREFDPEGALEAERTRLRWNVESDVVAFVEALEADRYAEALDLVDGDLLEGFALDDAPEFSDWLDHTREELRQRWRSAVRRHAADLEGAGRYAEAAASLEPLCDADPFDEDLLRRLLVDLAASGKLDRAQQRFDRVARTMEREFATEPERATIELLEQLRSGQPLPPSAPPAPQPAPTQQLPAQLTPFLGRSRERVRIADHLTAPECRLLTVVAPGGMGKTRLAIAAATEQQKRFADGVRFVSLAAVAEPQQLVYAIAEALPLTLLGGGEPAQALFAHLAGRELLLVLDNLEHLLDGAPLIGELLAAAPGVKVLATSRERLDLRAEWVFDLQGLDYPTEHDLVADPEALAASEAVALFLQGAQRVRHDIVTDPETVRQIGRICRLVAGMPLAIELAVSWLRILDPAEIGDEIAQGIDILETSFGDLPERQRSIRAVFDHSWGLLSEGQRTALAALSAFRDGFDRSAAQSVAEAGTRTLLELVGKALLHRDDAGRFGLHPLVAEYARERLEADPERARAVRDRHGEHYYALLNRWGVELRRGDQKEALAQLSAELNNVRTAWRWAIVRGDPDGLIEACSHIERLFTQRNNFRDGIAVLALLVDGLDPSVPDRDVTVGRALVSQAWLYFRLGAYDQGQRAAERARTLFPPHDESVGHMEAYNILGAINGQSGRYREAQGHFEQALAMAVRTDRTRYTAFYVNNLAIVAKEQGDYRLAERHYRQALELNRNTGDRISTIRNLNNLGNLHLIEQRFDEADEALTEANRIARDLGALQPLTHTLLSLGESARQRGDAEAARTAITEALSATREGGARNEEALALRLLALLDLAEGDLDRADETFRCTLEIEWEIESEKGMLATLLGLASLWSKRGHEERAAATLRLIADHEAADRPTQEEARSLLGAIGDGAGGGPAVALDVVVAEVLGR